MQTRLLSATLRYSTDRGYRVVGYSNKYLILTEYEVNIGNKSRVKDRGEAEVFYEVFISYTDQVRSQY